MEDNLRFETAAAELRERPSERVPAAWIAVALLALLAVIFQVFLRYEYVARGPDLWRIDRITRQACRVAGPSMECTDAARSTSTSTSTSLSISPSTAVRVSHKRPH